MINKNLLDEILKKVPDLQEIANQVKKQSEEFIIEESGAAGFVKVKMHGSKKIVSVELSQELIDMNDKKMMEDLIKATVNKAYERVNEVYEQRMNEKMTEALFKKIDLFELFESIKK